MNDLSVRKFYGWFTVLGLLISVLVVVGYYRDEYREWKDYQAKFIKEEIRRAATPQQRALAESTPVPIRQILLSDLNRPLTIRFTSNTHSSDSAAPSAIAARAAPPPPPMRTATCRTGIIRCCRCNTSRPPAVNATRPPTIPPRLNWPAASRCSRTAVAAAATNSMASVV